MPKFRKLNVILVIVFLLNLLYFLSLSYQSVYTWKAFYTSRIPQESTQRVLKLPERSMLSPEFDKKIRQIKIELNDSSITDDAVYPGLRIGRYIMMNPHLCRDVDRVDVIIMVHTAPKHLDKRQRMRDSYAKESLFLPFHVKIVFLLGTTMDKDLNTKLTQEHYHHNDTVMGDFVDDYHNLTLKGTMGYRWISQYCSNAKFVLKIDDDVLINMYKFLYSFLNHMNGKKKAIFCNLWHKDTMPILRGGKWRVKNNQFSSRHVFPYDYCSGFVVVITNDLIAPLYEASRSTPFFWIDDVYLFGMLPSVVGNVTFYNYALNQNITLNDKLAINCTRTLGPKCPIFATFISGGAYWTYWELIKSVYTTGDWKVENKLVH